MSPESNGLRVMRAFVCVWGRGGRGSRKTWVDLSSSLLYKTPLPARPPRYSSKQRTPHSETSVCHLSWIYRNRWAGRMGKAFWFRFIIWVLKSVAWAFMPCVCVCVCGMVLWQVVTMKGISYLAPLLLLVIIQNSWQVPLQAEDNSRYSSFSVLDENRFLDWLEIPFLSYCYRKVI